MPNTGVPCSNAVKTRNQKLPDRSQPLVGRSSPYCENMWRRYCCLTSFFSDCRYVHALWRVYTRRSSRRSVRSIDRGDRSPRRSHGVNIHAIVVAISRHDHRVVLMWIFINCWLRPSSSPYIRSCHPVGSATTRNRCLVFSSHTILRAVVWVCGRGQTQTHRRAWPQYLSLRLQLTRNVSIGLQLNTTILIFAQHKCQFC